MSKSNPIIDLSERSISLAGLAFSNVYDHIQRDAIRDHHVAGVMLLGEMQRLGLSVTRPRQFLSIDTERLFNRRDEPTVPLPIIDVYERTLRMWEDPEATLELPILALVEVK